MIDGYNRKINYLRISLTDRCNFRCVYCMPPQGREWLQPSEILSYEELLRVIAIFGKLGVENIRLTGGEPLVRKDIVDFVAGVTALGVVKDLSMTTNGSLLPPIAEDLKKAGLNRINISLDTVNPASFSRLTTCGRLDDTLQGVKSALAAELTPVKLNVVLTEMLSVKDLVFFTELVLTQPVYVRFIEYMPIGKRNIGKSLDITTVRKIINEVGQDTLKPTRCSRGNGPARYFHFPKAQGLFGFITPISDHFCDACNRLRLTADGKLKPCLLSNQEIDIKTPLRRGASDDEIAELFFLAARSKPEMHTLCRASGYPGFERSMSQIGG